MRCDHCGELGIKNAMVGLNGRWFHVACFNDGLTDTLAPLKKAMRAATREG